MDLVEWTVLGRVIGTATGWDDIDGSDFILYDFVPTSEVDLPSGELCVLLEKGLFEMYDDAGDVKFSADIVTTLRDIVSAA
jgi:hypothetical protein